MTRKIKILTLPILHFDKLSPSKASRIMDLVFPSNKKITAKQTHPFTNPFQSIADE